MGGPSLGVSIKWEGDSADRMVVAGVDPNGFADAAGVQAGDVILELGGLAPIEFVRTAVRTGPVRVVLERNGKTVIRYLEFPDASSPAATADPFVAMFAEPRADAEEAPASPEVAELRRQVEARRPPSVCEGTMAAGAEKHLQAAPPLADDGQAEREWLTKYGRTGREAAPPMTGMRPGWTWIDTQT